MSDTEIKLNIEVAEVGKLNLEPGDVLMVKLVGDYFMDADMDSLSNSLKGIFPDNKVMVCIVPSGNDMKLEIVSPESIADIKIAAKIPSLDTISGRSVINYCDDCSCGKKEAALNNERT